MNVKYFYGSFWQWIIFLLNVVLVHFCFYSSSGAWGSRVPCISFVCLSLLQLIARLRFALASFLFLAQCLRFYSLLLPSTLLLFLSLCLRHDVRKGCWAQFCCLDSVSDATFIHRTLKPAHLLLEVQNYQTELLQSQWDEGQEDIKDHDTNRLNLSQSFYANLI